MSARSKSFILLIVGLYVLAWAVYPFGGLMAVHPITWFQLFVALLCITMALVELISRNHVGAQHELQITSVVDANLSRAVRAAEC
jgi:hypothetical protein